MQENEWTRTEMINQQPEDWILTDLQAVSNSQAVLFESKVPKLYAIITSVIPFPGYLFHLEYNTDLSLSYILYLLASYCHIV